jgi:hypothetical protein
MSHQKTPFTLASSLRSLLALAFSTVLMVGTAEAYDMQGATIEMKLKLPDGDKFEYATNEEKIKDHFNLAHCVCNGNVGDAARKAEFQIEFSLAHPTMVPGSFAEHDVEIWLGTSCDSAPDQLDVRNDNCVKPFTFADIEELKRVPSQTFLVHDLLAKDGICPDEVGTRAVFALVDDEPEGIEGEDYSAAPFEITYDMKPPSPPMDITGSAAEEAVQLSWELPTNATDIRHFQVLCARADGTTQAGEFGGTPLYLTSRSACGDADDDTGPVNEMGVVSDDLPQELRELNASTICAEASGTQTGIRVEGLENGVTYRLVLLAIDDARNVTALDVGEHTPAPVQDAWEHYKENGGAADGGYCFVATATFGNYDHPFVRILRDFRDDTLAQFAWGRGFIDWYYETSPGLAAFIAEHESARIVSYVLLAPLVAFAAFWEYTGLIGKLLFLGLVVLYVRRRRSSATSEKQQSPSRPRRLALVTGCAALLLALSATAHAQPYWDELNEPIDDGTSTPNWNFEVKFGPYFPEVDNEFMGSGSGPFETVFGDNEQLMTFLSIDRFLLFPAGQFGVTASVGFSNQSARAFKVDSNGNPIPFRDGRFERSEGDKTKFRLIPTSIGAVYRFTKLDDDFGIPVIPYAKAGLSYYLWWFSDPAGNTSETPSIAIRAERIDPSAELSLRTEMGIEHAGFFAELQLANVDGFGADDKLSVGDTTWFGGINFEF